MSDLWLCLNLRTGHKLPVRASAIVAFPSVMDSDPDRGTEVYIAGHDDPFVVIETQDELRRLLGVRS